MAEDRAGASLEYHLKFLATLSIGAGLVISVLALNNFLKLVFGGLSLGELLLVLSKDISGLLSLGSGPVLFGLGVLAYLKTVDVEEGGAINPDSISRLFYGMGYVAFIHSVQFLRACIEVVLLGYWRAVGVVVLMVCLFNFFFYIGYGAITSACLFEKSYRPCREERAAVSSPGYDEDELPY